MVKRYDENTEALGCLIDVMVESDNSDYVLASDFDRVRRRLVVKLLRERSRFVGGLSKARFRKDGAACVRKAGWAIWFNQLADAIERGEPLEYFRELGSD